MPHASLILFSIVRAQAHHNTPRLSPTSPAVLVRLDRGIYTFRPMTGYLRCVRMTLTRDCGAVRLQPFGD
jgi:hypothetical protein